MSAQIDVSHETPEEEYLRHRRRMYRWVVLVCILGLSACIALLLWGRERQLGAEHYEFRQKVRPGISADEVVAQFGSPYRTFLSSRVLEPVLAGRGRYQRFDRTEMPEQFDRVLHYRTTLEHGEFVFVDESGMVIAVITGRGHMGGR